MLRELNQRCVPRYEGQAADEALPESYTCFFQLKLPNYTSKAILHDKLL